MKEQRIPLFREGNKTILLLCGLLLISVGISAYLAYELQNLHENMDRQDSLIDKAVVPLNMGECVPINSVPIIIESPGTYCLAKDFKTDETPIVIDSDNVQINLAGHSLQGPGTSKTRSIGISWKSHSNITISNGTIKGFFYGIRGSAPYEKISLEPGSAASDIHIHNLVLLDNTFRGIRVDAARVIINSNLVQATGGTTVYDDAYSIGIEIVGPECMVKGNWILETYPVGVGESVAISLSSNVDGCVVMENYIANKNLLFPGRSFAIWITVDGNNIQVIDNLAKGYTYPFNFKYSSTDIIIARNVFSDMECSLSDYPDYYQEYPYTLTNQFISEVDGCASDDVAVFLPLAERGDPLAMYRLGQIINDPCESRKWWQRAADLGHKESMRMLDTHKNIFEHAGCK